MPSSNFGDSIRKSIDKVTKQAVKNATVAWQPELDRLCAKHKGGDPAATKRALKQFMTTHGLSGIADTKLTTLAQQVVDGTRIKLTS